MPTLASFFLLNTVHNSWLTRAVFYVFSERAVPYISWRYRNALTLWRKYVDKVRSFFINVPFPDTGIRSITLGRWPSGVNDEGRFLCRGPGDAAPREMPFQPSVVIYATGYRPSLSFLHQGDYPTLDEAVHRGIYRDISEGFAYIGFVRPSIGEDDPESRQLAPLTGIFCF